MARSRQRLADFEARSVQIIAAFTLGLAGMSTAPTSPVNRVGAHPHTLNTSAAAALHSNTRTVPLNTTTRRSGRT
ncbi:hypothetical protein [Hydrogenophaga sp.]|uniref:hypothetical protein n=1 Tax=Hydrogenophaga sp. TaxID=1904254 RepID=UPI00271FBCB7|nr:hypothetical protein [Hydrogenophaga sp.]MDO8906275.1 hypothetical protein [Hydrogenophaga sp.]